MNLKELLDGYSDNDQIVVRLIELYPDQKKNLVGYYKTLKELRTLKPKKGEIKLKVEQITDDNETFTSVSGWKGGNTNWALDFTSWNEWLGMEFLKKSINAYAPGLDLVCHCLWEMTWNGYSQKAIIEQRDEIVNRVEEVKRNIKK